MHQPGQFSGVALIPMKFSISRGSQSMVCHSHTLDYKIFKELLQIKYLHDYHLKK